MDIVERDDDKDDIHDIVHIVIIHRYFVKYSTNKANIL